MRELFATPQFQKDLKIVPKRVKEQADALLFQLRLNPVDLDFGIKKLVGIKPFAWRI